MANKGHTQSHNTMKTIGPMKPSILTWMATIILCSLPGQIFSQTSNHAPGEKGPKRGYILEHPDKSLSSSSSKESVDPKASVDEILDLELDQLNKVDVVVSSFAVEVSSVTRNESTVGKSPAPVYVIDSEMIRRSTATSLPELLRTVPGLNVSKIDSNRWAISARGFNGGFSNKLLVLVDGRSIYSPVFSGVFWDRQDFMLENIEQIEVIRGPGASVWGANAVNGVINIISKHSQDTQGSLLTIGGGTEDKAITSVRYGNQSKGDEADSNWSYRVYGKHAERGSGFLPDQQSADDWRSGRVGFRGDWWDKDRQKQLMVQSEIYNVVAGTNVVQFPSVDTGAITNFPFERTAIGGHAMVQWTEQLNENNDYKVLAYFDHREAESYYSNQTLDIINVEYQRNARLLDYHEVSFGLGYQGVYDELPPDNSTSVFNPLSRYTNRFSTFVQDSYSIVPDELLLLGGIKLEHNDYSGYEYQPTLRLLRMLDNRRAAWAAVSRAVRTPSRFESDLRLLTPLPSGVGLGAIQGNDDLEAENLTSLELGYRAQPTDQFSWDIAGYFNHYSDLILISPFAPPSGFPPVVPFTYSNQGSAAVGGFEINASLQVNPCWKLAGWYSFNNVDFKDFTANSFLAGSGAFGRNNAFLRSSHCLRGNTELDAYLRYVDNVPEFNAPSYIQMDIRFGWKLSPNSRFSISATNLLDSQQFEFLAPVAFERGTGNQRSAFAQFTWTR